MYFYTIDSDGTARSEWILPQVKSDLVGTFVLSTFSPTIDQALTESNPLDNRKVVKEGVLSWRLRQDKKWSYSFVVVYR